MVLELEKCCQLVINIKFFLDNTIIGAGYRNNAVCPICYSKDKDRLVYYYLKKYTNIFKDKENVLHIAPEGQLRRRIKNNRKINYIDGDINLDYVSNYIDITNIQYDDNYFDYIIINHVLEHVLDENKAIMELIRVLNRNGKLIITVPICLNHEHTFEDNSIVEPKLRMKYFCQEDHVRLYGKDFKQRIEKYNVLVQEFKLNDQEKKLLKRNCVLEDGIIFIITKK